jgi:hypothetical protein
MKTIIVIKYINLTKYMIDFLKKSKIKLSNNLTDAHL